MGICRDQTLHKRVPPTMNVDGLAATFILSVSILLFIFFHSLSTQKPSPLLERRPRKASEFLHLNRNSQPSSVVLWKMNRQAPFHVIHKLPPGDSPYVRAKHVQLVEKDPEAAIVLFWKAIRAGDRVDSALKDMAVVMKQQDRAEEAIEAITSMRHCCSKQAQESLDNVLIDLYKKCGRIDEQIELLKQKLRMINQGEAFNGKPTKTARSHGRKFQVTIKKETSRILGNLGWAYMQQGNHKAAEVVYDKAQLIDPDANKACNLCFCLIKQARYAEARAALEDVLRSKVAGADDPRSQLRAGELLQELEQCQSGVLASIPWRPSVEDAVVEGLDQLMNHWTPFRSKRLPIFEEIYPFRDQLAC